MKIGIFTVCMPEFEPEECLQVAAELGYDGLEWRICEDKGDRAKPSFWNGNRTSMMPEDVLARAESLKRTAAALKLEMPSLAAYISCFDEEKAEAAFAAAKAIGARNVRVNASAYDPAKSFQEQVLANKKQFAKMEQLARNYGVRAVTETHMGMLTPTVVGTMQILEGLDPQFVGVMWDPGNQVREGLERYDMAIGAAGEYLAEVHVKNGRAQNVSIENGHLVWTTDWCQLQMGEVDWCAVVKELKKAGYNGWLMMEDFSSAIPDTKARLKNNVDFLRSFCDVR